MAASRSVIEPLVSGAVPILIALAGLLVRRYSPSKPAGHRELLDQTPPGRGHEALALQLQIDALEAVRDAQPTARRMRRASRILQITAMINLVVIGAVLVYLLLTGETQAEAPDGARMIMGVSMGTYLAVFALFGFEVRAARKDHDYTKVLAWIVVLRRKLGEAPEAVPQPSARHRWWWRR